MSRDGGRDELWVAPGHDARADPAALSNALLEINNHLTAIVLAAGLLRSPDAAETISEVAESIETTAMRRRR